MEDNEHGLFKLVKSKLGGNSVAVYKHLWRV